jgi:GMP synthase (glutamine-hydrolysing)
MKPFLLLQSRPEDEASDNEYEGILEAAGLKSDQLKRIRVEAGPFPLIDLNNFSGIFIGGGPFNISKAEHAKSDNQKRVEASFLRLLDQVAEKDFPLFGICYGVGLVGLHQGGVVNDRYAEVLEPITITLTDKGESDPILANVPKVFQAMAGHKEACEILPSHAIHLASSPGCPVQMFRIKNNMYVTQFHPELNIHGLQVRVNIYKHAGYFPPEDAEKVIANARTADLSHLSIMLKNFVKRYSGAAG